MLRQLFDEMDANKKNMVHTLSHFLSFTFSLSLSLTHTALNSAHACTQVSLRELEQGLFGAKIRKTAAEEQRISIEFAMDKVLISLHNYAGNQGISQHACSLILEVCFHPVLTKIAIFRFYSKLI